MSNLNVLYQFNEKYAPFAGVSITSLFENNKDIKQIDVYILCESLSEETIHKFVLLGQMYERNIFFEPISEWIEKMKEWGLPAYRGSYAANIRMFFSMIIEQKMERLLYLDADTVVDGSLNKLLDVDMQEYPLAMVLDSLGHKHKRVLGIKEEAYFNSGVILFNVPAWKSRRCSERIVEYIKMDNNVNLPSPDQDLLNIVCKDEILCLAPMFNFQPVHLAFDNAVYYKWYNCKGYYRAEVIEEAYKEAVIYHFFRFLGEFPWDKNNVHPDRELFDKYLKKSLWKDYEKRKSSSSFLMIVEKIMYGILPKWIFLGIFKFAHEVYVEKKKDISIIG